MMQRRESIRATASLNPVLRPRALAAMAVCLAGLAAPASGQRLRGVERTDEPPLRLFLDASLNQRVLRLVVIDGDTITAIQDNGRTTQLSRSEVLAIAPPIVRANVVPAGTELNVWRDPTLVDADPMGRCDLVDGQVLPGRIWIQGSKAESLGWESRLWGQISLPLEAISVLTLRPGGTGRRDGLTDDVVWLVNGDRTGGFVAGIGESITVEDGGTKTELPAERVAGVGFANPHVAPAGTWVWLYDGTVSALSSLRVARGGEAVLVANVPSMTEQPKATLSVDELRAVAFDLSRVAPLAGQPFSSEGSAERRRWTPAPIVADVKAAPLGAADIELPGPMAAEWELPAGALRVSALCELPVMCRIWGDCEFFLELVTGGETRPLWHRRFNAADPEASFNVMLGNAGAPAGSKLRLRVEPGANGPIQDRIIVRRGLILLDPK